MNVTALRVDARYNISPQCTSSDYSDTDCDRHMNRWYRTVMARAIAAQGDWELNGDILTRNLSTGVTDYSIPANLISIYKAEVMYTTGGEFVPVKVISVQRNIGFVEGNSTRTFDDYSQPTLEVFGNYLQLRPAPTENVTNGFKLWAQVDFDDLDATTNNVPDLLEATHRIIAYGMAHDFCLGNDMYSKAAEMKRMIYGDPRIPGDNGLMAIVDQLYSMKDNARRDRITAARRSYK